MKKLLGLTTLFLSVTLISALGTIFILKPTPKEPVKPAVNGTEIEAEPIKTPIPKSNRILFVSDRTGNQEIFIMDLPNLHVVNVTKNPAADMNPQLSPDGLSMAFYSDREGKTNQIYLMNMVTREVKQLTSIGQNFDPSFSPDGKLIAFKSTRGDRLGDIFVMNADGSEQKNLTFSHQKTEEWDPTFTKDGKKIIFVSRLGTDPSTDEIFSMNADGTGMSQMTNNTIPDWYVSVDSTSGKLSFVSKNDPQSTDDIFVSNEDGSGRKSIISMPGNDDDPAWSPDGEQVIFINNDDEDYDMYLANADGSNVKLIEDTDSDELSPIFIPASAYNLIAE